MLNWAPFWISNRKGASEANFFIIGLTELIYISNYWKFQGEHIFVNLFSEKLKVFACIAKNIFDPWGGDGGVHDYTDKV